MRLEIPAQSIELRHLSYPLRRKLEAIAGSNSTTVISEDLLDIKDNDTTVVTADLANIIQLIRDASDDLYEEFNQAVDCLEAKINEVDCSIPLDIIFAADTSEAAWDVQPSTTGTIVWQNVQLDNNLIGYDSGSGVFTPQVAGYYRVDAYFNDLHVNSSTRQALRISSTNGTTPQDVDEYTGQTADRLAGHKIFYCNGTTDTFSVGMVNYDAGIVNRYNDPLQGLHVSYMTAEYVGTDKATN
jgi:hypothetical protein